MIERRRGIAGGFGFLLALLALRANPPVRGAGVAAAASVVVTYPGPKGARACADYKVTADGHDVFVYETGVHFEAEAQHETVGYGYFDTTGAVDVRIVSRKPVTSAVVRPRSVGIKAEVVSGNEIRFRMERPAKVAVDVNGKVDGGLILFARAPEVHPPLPTDPHVIYFGPGIHTYDANEYDVMPVKSGETIYVAGGAILRARILARDADHVRIMGRGIIDGSELPSRFPDYLQKLVGEKPHKYRPVFVDFQSCHDVRVEGVELIDSPAWTLRFVECRNAAARDLGLIGFVPNSDGMDIVNSQGVRVDDCFIRTADDAIVLKGNDDLKRAPKRLDVRDITVENCTLLADRASALEIGHETEAATISQVTFRNIDILDQVEQTIGYHAMDIHAGDEAVIHDILYDTIRVERCARLIGMEIEKSIFNHTAAWGRIHDVTFRNVQSMGADDVSLYGHSAEADIAKITFDDFMVRGKAVEPVVRGNGFVHDLAFTSGGVTRKVGSVVPRDLVFTSVDCGAAADHGMKAPIGGEGFVGVPAAGKQVLNGIPFDFAQTKQGVVVLPMKGTIAIGRKCRNLFVLQGAVNPAGPLNSVLWKYEIRYGDGTSFEAPVRLNTDVCAWDVWAAGGWVVKLNGHKFYIQMIANPHPEKVVESIGVTGAAASGTGVILGVTVGG